MKGIGWLNGSKGRGVKALGVSLAVGLGMTACSRDYTVAYVYATASTKGSTGVVDAYAVDYQSGALTPLADSGISSGGNNPVGLVGSPDQQHLYVINQTAPTSNVVQFNIGTDGKLYSANTYDVVKNTAGTIVGTTPTAIAIDPAGKFLYITFQYQNGFTSAVPGPGGIAIFPIASDGTLGSPVMDGNLPYTPVGNNPTGIAVSAKGGFVYVIDQEKPAGSAAFGALLGFTQNSNGSLTPIAGGTVASGTGFAAGDAPAGIAIDPGGHFIYVTDEATNVLYGYVISTGGVPVAANASPYATGSFPLGVTVDPRGEYVYVANFGSSTVGAYAINQSLGSLSTVAGSAGVAVATGPTCVTVDPALGVYLYTSNNTDNSISGEKIKPETGALSEVQGSQFPTAALPTCAVAVANGVHATQLVD